MEKGDRSGCRGMCVAHAAAQARDVSAAAGLRFALRASPRIRTLVRRLGRQKEECGRQEMPKTAKRGGPGCEETLVGPGISHDQGYRIKEMSRTEEKTDG